MQLNTLGDWCKFLERNFSPEIMIPTLPVIIRLDGSNFHKWTIGLDVPFDNNFTDLMIDTTKYLVGETNAVVGSVHSDEITLILYSDNKRSLIYNDGKKQKILSKLTSKCVLYFNKRREYYLPKHEKLANFDCRIYQTPTLHDACNQLLWRENDATKNSISMLARSLYSHNELQDLDGNEMQNKMFTEKNVNWNDLPSKFKKGTYVKRIKTSKPFSVEEIKNLPKNHNAHKNPNMIIERNIISIIDLPILNKIKNKTDVIFFNLDPIVED
jgi:tRNA(His) guanylyltransferase